MKGENNYATCDWTLHNNLMFNFLNILDEICFKGLFISKIIIFHCTCSPAKRC